MVSVEYRLLQLGVGRLNVVRLARCVFESKGARDSFEQCATSLSKRAAARRMVAGRYCGETCSRYCKSAISIRKRERS
jgi:hypothetical protein